MYCSSCGASVAQGLSYCNYCGAKLNGKRDDGAAKSLEVKPEFLLAAMVAVFVFGLGAIIGLVAVLNATLGSPLALAFAVVSFLLMIFVEGVFVWLLLRRRRGAAETGDAAPPKEQATKELDAARAGALPEPAPSVTEHTTRLFEPAYSERKSE